MSIQIHSRQQKPEWILDCSSFLHCFGTNLVFNVKHGQDSNLHNPDPSSGAFPFRLHALKNGYQSLHNVEEGILVFSNQYQGTRHGPTSSATFPVFHFQHSFSPLLHPLQSQTLETPLPLPLQRKPKCCFRWYIKCCSPSTCASWGKNLMRKKENMQHVP